MNFGRQVGTEENPFAEKMEVRDNYFNVSVGEENTAVAAVQDYTKLYCKNTPEALAGGNPPDDTKDQAAAKEKEIRSKIAALTIQHME